ncbi:unnamed protein product, partial [Pelagomonas calceolata]
MESWEQLRAQARKIEAAWNAPSSISVARGRRRQRRRGAAAPEDGGGPPQGAGGASRLAAGRGGASRRRARKAVVERCRAVVVDYSSDVGRVAKQLRKNADRAKLFGRGRRRRLGGRAGPPQGRAPRAEGDDERAARSGRRHRAGPRGAVGPGVAARDPRGLYKHGAVADGPAPVDRLDHPENAPEEVPGERRRRRDGRVLRVVFALGRARRWWR